MSSGESAGIDQGSRHFGHDAVAGDVSCRGAGNGVHLFWMTPDRRADSTLPEPTEPPRVPVHKIVTTMVTTDPSASERL